MSQKDRERVNAILQYAVSTQDLELVHACLDTKVKYHLAYFIKIVKLWLEADFEVCQKALRTLDPKVMAKYLNDYRDPSQGSKMATTYRTQLRRSFYKVVARLSLNQFKWFHIRFKHPVSFEAIAFAMVASNQRIVKKYLYRAQNLKYPKNRMKLVYICDLVKPTQYYQEFVKALGLPS